MRVYRSYPRGGCINSVARSNRTGCSRSAFPTHEPHGTPWAAALEARMLCGLFDQVCGATKGDGVAFPGEADCIEVELADRLVRGCYLVGKAVAVN